MKHNHCPNLYYMDQQKTHSWLEYLEGQKKITKILSYTISTTNEHIQNIYGLNRTDRIFISVLFSE